MMRQLASGLAMGVARTSTPAAVLLAVLLAVVAPHPVTAQSVMDRVVAAYGGLEAVQAVESYRQEGMSAARDGGGHGKVARSSRGAATLRVMVDYLDRVPRILVHARSEIAVETTDEGTPVRVPPVGDAMSLRMYVDPETHYIVRSESVFLNASAPLGFATDHSDLRRVGDVVFPFPRRPSRRASITPPRCWDR